MPRKKSVTELRKEWHALDKDWYSIYQWPSLAVSAYTEETAALILAHYTEIRLNVVGLRQANYALDAHRGQCALQTNISQFTEKRFVRAMYNLGTHHELGQMLDYEVPLKAYQAAPHGDIDLLSQLDDSLLVIECKQHHSKESILKGLLQAYTYTRLVNEVRDGFRRSFRLKDRLTLTPAVLVFKATTAGIQLQSLGRYPYTRDLLRRMNNELEAISLGRTRFYLGTDSDAVIDGSLIATPYMSGDALVSFRQGFVPAFGHIEV